MITGEDYRLIKTYKKANAIYVIFALINTTKDLGLGWVKCTVSTVL